MPYVPQSTGELKGLNDALNPLSLENGELREAHNAARYGEYVGTRPGTEREPETKEYENPLTDDSPVQGMFEYRKNFDTDRKLVVVAEDQTVTATDHLWYEDDARYDFSASANAPSITGGADFLWTMAEHENKLYGAGGDPTAPDDFWVLDAADTAAGPERIQITNGAADTYLHPQYCASWRNYFFINGLSQGAAAPNASDNPAATRFCNFLGDPANITHWGSGNTIGFSTAMVGVDSFGKTYTTGFGRYQDNDGDYLLILANNGLVAAALEPSGLNDFRIIDPISNGCVGQHAFVNLGVDAGDAIYMSHRGIHSLRQSQEHGSLHGRFLSDKIREFWKTLNRSRMKYAVGAYDDRHGWVVFALSTGSNTYNDKLLCLDVSDTARLTADTARWYLWTLSGDLKVNNLLWARDEDDSEYHLYAGTTTGDVIRFTTDIYSDVTAGAAGTNAYNLRVRTADASHGSLTDNKSVGDVMVQLQAMGSWESTYQTIFDMGNLAGKAKSLKNKNVSGVTWADAGAPVATDGVWDVSGWSKETASFTTFVWGTGSGSTIAHRIVHTGENQPVRIGRIDYEVMGTGDAEASQGE